MAKKDDAKPEGEAGVVEATDSPLLDLSDAAVKRMMKLAKKRGFVTYAELNAVLPSEEVTSDQIEDVYAVLNEMGINVIEAEEADETEEESGPEEEEAEGGELIEAPASKAVATRASEPADRTDDPVRMYLREMGSVELSVLVRSRMNTKENESSQSPDLAAHARTAVSAYLRVQPFYEDLASVVARLIQECLKKRAIKVHSVQHRAKDASGSRLTFESGRGFPT
ncbi:RNA polymerase sigma factor region1.1 domain-containing protein, partial [Rhodoblastus sp.]|uniref:RNA polymerase sigma factor region1.1 domain-containing protein n=1 Tax=Rhodoblastus sp. TaxID=1962975 RepID=UPI003F9C2B5C